MQVVIRRKLPIKVFWEAFVFPFTNFGALFQIFFFPSLLLMAIAAAALWLFWPPGADVTTTDGLQGTLLAMSPLLNILNIILVIFSIMFAVHIHRYIVNEEDPGWVLFRFRRYELMYLLTAIVIFLCFVLTILAVVGGVMLLLGVSLDPEMWARLQSGETVQLPVQHGWLFALIVALYVLFFWVVVRLVLMLPHAAITGRLSFSTSWRAMKGNFWRFVLACLLFSLLVMALFLLAFGGGYLGFQAISGVTFEPGAQITPEQSRVLFLELMASYSLLAVIGLLYFAMTVALISYTYAYLIGAPGPEAAAM
jgi:hypothetical protein